MLPLVREIELNPVSRSFTAFTDQTPNQELARLGSLDGSLATLDLSEASDRVANWLVEELFADYPHFLEGIQACRSTRCRLPSGEVIPLLKFASMGSALTFPIEAMIFTAISILGCLGMSRSPTMPLIKRLVGSVRVYGDDIIVPVDKAVAVSEMLETFGFQVNQHKSFWNGPFRESCGKEYFFGEDVSIVKSRRAFPDTRHCVPELVSLVSFRNQLCEAGWLDTVEMLDTEILHLLGGRFPYVSGNSSLLGRVGPDRPEIHRGHPTLHRPEAKGYCLDVRIPHSPLSGIPALTKCLMHPEITLEQIDHLKRSGRPRAVGLKLAWAPVY
uniref:RNA-directed RNA polymerase n=1 Tax=Leviviridae sp. TaxID=2027243 RepID=A0A514D2Z3_9VIRU|nr:MAG: RNA-dependent RNA polymerase [Leviviridae sp.]